MISLKCCPMFLFLNVADAKMPSCRDAFNRIKNTFKINFLELKLKVLHLFYGKIRAEACAVDSSNDAVINIETTVKHRITSEPINHYVTTSVTAGTEQNAKGGLNKPRSISHQQLKVDGKQNGWVALHHQVYSLKEFAQVHPGGAELIVDEFGSDATALFDDQHDASYLEKLSAYVFAKLE